MFLLALALVFGVLLTFHLPPWAVALIVTALVGGALISFGVGGRDVSPRGRVVFTNAVTLTDASERPEDSWVHVVRERRGGSGAIGAGFLLCGLTIAALPLFAVLFGPSLTQTQAASGWQPVIGFVIGSVLAVGIGVLAVVLGVHRLVAWYRLGSFGRIPVGVAFGRTGVRALTPDGEAFLRWDDIDAVHANWIEVRTRNGGVTMPTIDVMRGGRRVRLRPDLFDVGGLVVLTAMRTFHGDSRARALLGDGAGQRLFDTWSEQDRRRQAVRRATGR